MFVMYIDGLVVGVRCFYVTGCPTGRTMGTSSGVVLRESASFPGVPLMNPQVQIDSTHLERVVLAIVVDGSTSKVAAQLLGISPRTVEFPSGQHAKAGRKERGRVDAHGVRCPASASLRILARLRLLSRPAATADQFVTAMRIDWRTEASGPS